MLYKFQAPFVMAVIAPSSARPAAAFEISAEFATASISSALFIIYVPLTQFPIGNVVMMKDGIVETMFGWVNLSLLYIKQPDWRQGVLRLF